MELIHSLYEYGFYLNVFMQLHIFNPGYQHEINEELEMSLRKGEVNPCINACAIIDSIYIYKKNLFHLHLFYLWSNVSN